MCASNTLQPNTAVDPRNFIRNERWDEDTNCWYPIAGTRLPDNKSNRRRAERDILAYTKNGMRVRTIQYEIREENLIIIFGEGAVIPKKG